MWDNHYANHRNAREFTTLDPKVDAYKFAFLPRTIVAWNTLYIWSLRVRHAMLRWGRCTRSLAPRKMKLPMEEPTTIDNSSDTLNVITTSMRV